MGGSLQLALTLWVTTPMSFGIGNRWWGCCGITTHLCPVFPSSVGYVYSQRAIRAQESSGQSCGERLIGVADFFAAAA